MREHSEICRQREVATGPETGAVGSGNPEVAGALDHQCAVGDTGPILQCSQRKVAASS